MNKLHAVPVSAFPSEIKLQRKEKYNQVITGQNIRISQQPTQSHFPPSALDAKKRKSQQDKEKEVLAEKQ